MDPRGRNPGYRTQHPGTPGSGDLALLGPRRGFLKYHTRDISDHRGRHKTTLCFRKGCLGLRPKHACVAHGCRQWPVLGPQKGTHFGTLSDPRKPLKSPKSPISTLFRDLKYHKRDTSDHRDDTKRHSSTPQTCLRHSISPTQ